MQRECVARVVIALPTTEALPDGVVVPDGRVVATRASRPAVPRDWTMSAESFGSIIPVRGGEREAGCSDDRTESLRPRKFEEIDSESFGSSLSRLSARPMIRRSVPAWPFSQTRTGFTNGIR